jgi:hypothetical protein
MSRQELLDEAEARHVSAYLAARNANSNPEISREVYFIRNSVLYPGWDPGYDPTIRALERLDLRTQWFTVGKDQLRQYISETRRYLAVLNGDVLDLIVAELED